MPSLQAEERQAQIRKRLGPLGFPSWDREDQAIVDGLIRGCLTPVTGTLFGDTKRLIDRLMLQPGLDIEGEVLLDCYVEALSDIIFGFNWLRLRGTAGRCDPVVHRIFHLNDDPPERVLDALHALELVPGKQLALANSGTCTHRMACPNLLFPAAAVGNLHLCRLLIEGAGVSPFQTNSTFAEPVSVAEARRHEQVVAYLQSRIRSIGAERAGSGAAFDLAMNDEGRIVQVLWYAPEMVGRWLGCHSFLRVLVQGDDGATRNYVLEKWRHPFHMLDQFKNGVAISTWQEVSGKYPRAKPWRCLDDLPPGMEQLQRPAPRIKDVHKAMVDLGGYNVLSSNCHHAALAGFNRCAAPGAQARSFWDDPNGILVGAGRWLKTFGVDVNDFESESCGCDIGIDSQSSGSSFYGHGFVILNTTPGGTFEEALKAAELSELIYSEGRQPPGWCEEYEVDRKSNVAWAVYTSQDTIHIVFKGTTEALDAVVDMDVTMAEAFGLGVHGGMNTALNAYGHKVRGKVRRCVNEIREQRPKLRKMVLQGHSLGGGYAILQACDFFYEGIVGIDREDIKVVTFGAPQVVLPDPVHKIWQLLNDSCTNYIFAWDPVPRLPGATDWHKALLQRLPSLAKHLMPETVKRITPPGARVRLSVDDEAWRNFLGDKFTDMVNYGHVGKIVFIATNCQHAWTLQAGEKWYKQVPAIPPPKEVKNLADFHSMEKAYLAAVRGLAQAPRRPPGNFGGA